MIRKYVVSIPVIILCLANNLQAMDIDEACRKQLERAAQEYSNLDLQERESIVRQTHDWALTHNPHLLDKAYEKLVDGYRYRCRSLTNSNGKERKKAYDSLLFLLDQYAEVNPESAMKKLEYLIDNNVLGKRFVYEYYSEDLPTFPIKVLQVLKKRDPSKFELTSKKVVSTRLNSFLLLALAHPEQMEQLEDETLSVGGLIKTALHNVRSHPKKANNLENILRHGTAYHTQFEREIAELLPGALKNSCIGSDLIGLFKSPSDYLRWRSLSTLLGYIADGSEDVYWKKEIIKDLLEHEADAPLQGAELYQALFNTFLKSTSPASDFGIQLLIQHLINQSSNVDSADLGRSFLGQYLNISSEHAFHNQQFSINDSFELAVKAGAVTLEQLNNMYAVAQETGFEGFINPDIIQKFKIKMILNETIPRGKRAQFFRELLTNRIASNENYADLVKHIDQLPFSPFKRYAHAILIALDPKSHQTASFGARADLVELSKQYSGFCDNPDILRRHRYELLFEAFNEQQKPEASHIHVEVKQGFASPIFPEGPYCFGYVCNNMENTYRLYACNKKTGLPVWMSPVIGNLPYAILKDSMFCATKSGSIVKLDTSNGDTLQEFTLEDTGKIKQLYATSDQEKLYVLYEESAFLIDLKTGAYQKIMFPEKSNEDRASFVGDRLIIPSLTDFFIIDNKGHTMKIPHHPSDFYFPLVEGTNQFMVYDREDEQTYQSILVCLDSNTSKQLWEYPIDSLIQSKVSPNNDFIFVLTDRAVMAFATNPKESGPLVWKTDLGKNSSSKINSIYLSNDSSTLYGLETRYGKLYKFDIETGEKTFLYEKKLSHRQNIVGDFNNKLYIQGTHY